MMRKSLMTVMTAVALGGLFTGCTKEMESVEGNTAQLNVMKVYEEAFITRFGQPAATQTWGFGPATAGTRAEGSPSVSEIGYSFNATMAKAWDGVEGTPTVMANYTSWRNSGWNDKLYQINGTVVPANIDATLREKAYTAILEKIPERGYNLPTASATGYSITTKGGPVTLTPIYHYSSSGDKIIYYYYPAGTTPDVKNIKKYVIGNMADPQACAADNRALNEYTYSLVYDGPNGPTYEFPEGYEINFIISNTDLVNGQLTIANNTIVAERNWTGVADNTLPWIQFADPANGSAKGGADGIEITVNSAVNLWQPQLNVLEGLNLSKGGNYKVVVVAKFPTDGQLQINMGDWSNNVQYNFPVKTTGDFQEVECEFLNYGVNNNANIFPEDVAGVTNGHVLFQCGNFLGTTIIKSVKVIELATKTIDNSPEFYGDGTYNQEVHESTIPLGEGYHWAVSPSSTSHIAVFKTDYTDAEGNIVDLNLIGFEDWTDLDYNDVIFAVTGTRGGTEVNIEEPDDPMEFVCRVIAEDLTVSQNTDFDFNDVVFDVYKSGRIRIRACGGTLPLKVDGQEVHGLFGKETGDIINTGWDGAIDYEKRYRDIQYSGGTVADAAAANLILVEVFKQGQWMPLTAPAGEVASKIAVGNDYPWCAEREDIDSKWHLNSDGYKPFSDYVQGIIIGDAWYQMVIEEAAKYQNKKNKTGQ